MIQTPDDVLKRLTQGNQRFASGQFSNKNRGEEKRKETVAAQNPYAIVLTCSDSRVIPELIFDVGIGELFVVRIAGNIVTSEVIGTMDFVVGGLDPKLIIVLGHQNCVAVSTAMTGGQFSPQMSGLLDQIRPAVKKTPGADLEKTVWKNAELSAAKLCSESALIAESSSEGRLKVVPGSYHLDSGIVEFR